MSSSRRPPKTLTFVVGTTLLTAPALLGGCDDKGKEPPTANPGPEPAADDGKAPEPEPEPPTINEGPEPEPDPGPEETVNEGPVKEEVEPQPTANPGPAPDSP